MGDDISSPLGMTTLDMLDNGYRGAFWMWAQVAGISEIQLNGDQSKQLAKETELTLRTLGTRRAKKVKKAIDTFLPGISLVVTALVLVVPRIQLQQRVKRAEHLGHLSPVETNAGTTSPTSSTNSTAPGSSAPNLDVSSAPSQWREVSTSAADLDEVAGRVAE